MPSSYGNLLRVIKTAALVALLVFVSTAAAQADSCQWQLSLAPNAVRFPLEMDIHAAYRIFAFQSDGTVGYRLHGEFPFAAFMSFTTYNAADALLYAALLDYQIEPDLGSIDPFIPGELVNASNRSYTVTLLPEGTVPDASMPNPIFFPPAAPDSGVVTAVLVERIYLAEPQLNDRFGGVTAPEIEAFEVSNPSMPAGCPTGDFGAVTNQFGSFADNLSQSPLPRNGKIEFYRPPVSLALSRYADGTGPLTEQDCTGYLMATVFPDELAVVHLAAVPSLFDNSNITPTTTFANSDVRYLSLGSYGASFLSAAQNENVAGPDIKTLPDGSATFVAIPSPLSSDLKQQVAKRAAELGYNVMPLARQGVLVNPFLIYRNKVPASGFPGNIQNAQCFQGSDFSQAPSSYAASTANMGNYAPVGIECTPTAFLRGRCGQ